MATAPVLAGTAIHAKAWRELVSAYVFISAAQRERLSPLGFPEERCFVKHNFVADPRSLDEADGNVDVSGEQATRPPVVTFVGRLDAAKGAPQLMAAWDILRTQRPVHPLNLVIAGGGPLTETVRHWAATRSEVSFLGMVDRSEVPALLGSARAAVVPSQWEETFGLVAVEAMAAGTPVLVADSGALPELVREGQDGAMFAPRDTHALAGLLSEVADHGQEWAARGLAARRSYLERFTERTNLDQLLGIYRYAIDHPIRWSAVAPVSQSRRPALLPR
jgi:glycosyltransferase involved in cell wall biosynthesis